MEKTNHHKDTAAWIFQAWASFLISVSVTGFGIVNLPVDTWIKSFLGMGLLFTVGSCFSLAKTLRDNAEAEQIVNRMRAAKAERLLQEFEPT